MYLASWLTELSPFTHNSSDLGLFEYEEKVRNCYQKSLVSLKIL